MCCQSYWDASGVWASKSTDSYPFLLLQFSSGWCHAGYACMLVVLLPKYILFHTNNWSIIIFFFLHIYFLNHHFQNSATPWIWTSQISSLSMFVFCSLSSNLSHLPMLINKGIECIHLPSQSVLTLLNLMKKQSYVSNIQSKNVESRVLILTFPLLFKSPWKFWEQLLELYNPTRGVTTSRVFNNIIISFLKDKVLRVTEV